jgi:hypothetical protein
MDDLRIVFVQEDDAAFEAEGGAQEVDRARGVGVAKIRNDLVSHRMSPWDRRHWLPTAKDNPAMPGYNRRFPPV